MSDIREEMLKAVYPQFGAVARTTMVRSALMWGFNEFQHCYGAKSGEIYENTQTLGAGGCWPDVDDRGSG
ncbi:hypothetical protein [Litorivivens lipolytica]|uniref:hypothetical protein n=1 Tax=Litorivivens lipolytica TaxID=1524264 RepID=UPI00161A959B|nr:hypothetical protein [Litorivivens lipolytica]